MDNINIKETAAYAMVKEFEKAMELTQSPETRIRLVKEELTEFTEVFGKLLKETVDVLYVLLGAYGADVALDEVTEVQTVEFLNFVNALEYVYPGITGKAFRRVHASNMSKFGPDGKPVVREDGKIMKGPNYWEPDLYDLVPTFIKPNVEA